MAARIFELDEANRMLPLVRVIVEDAHESARDVRRLAGVEGCPGTRRAIPSPEDLPEDASRRLANVRRCVEELEDLGAYLRDPEEGIVEWYAEVDGEIVYLSWKPGETEVRYWHGLFTGPQTRRPLPRRAPVG